MKENINSPSHYNFGKQEVIDIIESWGLIGDFDAANVLKYFLRAPYKNNEEEDYRKAMWYLDRIYERQSESDVLMFNNMTNSKKRIKVKQLNLEWLKPVNCFRGSKNNEISLSDVISGWRLNGNRKFFIQHFYYVNFHCEACIKSLMDLIEEVSGN